MSKLTTAAKRLVVGRPFRSDRLPNMLLPKRVALPVFASDPMSSLAYAPEEIMLTLSMAGLSAYAFTVWIGLVVALVMVAVVASYRQTVRAYPSGGGDYEVATVNHGPRWGVGVASALLVDYVLTVAVSVSAVVANIGSLVPLVGDHKVAFGVAVVLVLTAANLRGMSEGGRTFAIITYAFVVGILGMIIYGLVRVLVIGESIRAESAGFELAERPTQLAGIGFVFLVLRAFSTGSVALTGVETIANGVPAFRKPKARNAATTLLVMGTIAVTMFLGVLVLARISGLVIAAEPQRLIGAPADYEQQTVVAQLANAVFADFTPAVYYVIILTGLVLVLAANTSFNGFPRLSSMLAQDRYLPRQLHTRGDRLTLSNGILLLAGFAIVLIIGFDARVTSLIQLYIVGVFVSFVLSQSGMIRHWNRQLSTTDDRATRRRMRRSQAINTFGLVMTAGALLVVLVTKFLAGAWIAIAAMGVMCALMTGIRKHYDRVATELRELDKRPTVLPSRNHAIVLVSTLHLPTLRALTYARATHPDVLEAVTVNVDDADTRALVAEWDSKQLRVPLKVIESPYREVTRPVLDYVRRVRGANPRNVVTVFIPEYVVSRWWEQLLHNQSALRLKGRLLFQPGVMVTSVPWQLASSMKNATGADSQSPGATSSREATDAGERETWERDE